MTKEASQQCFHKKYIISQSRPTNISATVAAAKASCNSCSQWGGCISEDCSKCSEQTGPELALALPAPSDLIQIILDLYFKIQVSQERVRERERQTDRQTDRQREREKEREREEASITFRSISGFALPSVIRNNQPPPCAVLLVLSLIFKFILEILQSMKHTTSPRPRPVLTPRPQETNV